jgi:hypothetical protein
LLCGDRKLFLWLAPLDVTAWSSPVTFFPLIGFEDLRDSFFLRLPKTLLMLGCRRVFEEVE